VGKISFFFSMLSERSTNGSYLHRLGRVRARAGREVTCGHRSGRSTLISAPQRRSSKGEKRGLRKERGGWRRDLVDNPSEDVIQSDGGLVREGRGHSEGRGLIFLLVAYFRRDVVSVRSVGNFVGGLLNLFAP
jgi:hypothetical protein